MKYREAVELCEGQEYAMEMPLKELPILQPDQEQETEIYCTAPLVPVIDKSRQHRPDRDNVTVHLGYVARTRGLCIMDRPDCKHCRIFDIAEGLQSGDVTLSNEDFKNNNLEAFTPHF